MAFFTPWQTWVKLTFVLGCAICVVLIYAVGVRYSTKRQLKKHTIRIATEIAERGELTEAVRRSEEVPFGVRAIERGCMVEGVWNSKASTPLQTPASSKANSPILRGKNTLNKHNRDTSLSNVSDVDIPEPASVTTQLRETGARLRHVPLENLRNTSRNQIAAGMLDEEREMPMRDDLADGPGPAISRDQTITATTYDLPPFGSGSQPGPSLISNADEFDEQLHLEGSASQISFTTRGVPGWARRPSHMRCPSSDKEIQPLSSTLRIVHPSRDIEALEYMNAHRRSHVAETGELIPRVRRKAGSGDFTTAPISESGKDNSSTRSASWPTSTSASCDSRTTPTTPSLPPNLEDLPIRILAKKFPLPPLRREKVSTQVQSERPPSGSEHVPFTEHGVRRQPNPASLCVKSRSATSKPCPSAWRDRVHEQLEQTRLNDEDSAKVPFMDAVLSHHNTATRQINAGFEVLPAGRLTMPTPVKEWGDAPSVSVHISNEARVVRKLQKRVRSRSRSRRSSSEHERQGEANTAH